MESRFPLTLVFSYKVLEPDTLFTSVLPHHEGAPHSPPADDWKTSSI